MGSTPITSTIFPNMKEHECKPSNTCLCRVTALEPDEKCPVHGAGEFPPRCDTCGRYVEWKEFRRKE